MAELSTSGSEDPSQVEEKTVHKMKRLPTKVIDYVNTFAYVS